MNIPNIYNSKNYKYYALLPVLLLFVSLFFVHSIQLDSSLKGGISIQLQTNASINVRNLTSIIDSRIPTAEASVSRSPGGLSIVIAENASIASALNYLLSIDNLYSNYTSFNVLAATYQNQLATQPNNSTLKTLLGNAQGNETRYTLLISSTLASELATLKDFNVSQSYNSSSSTSMVNAAKNSYDSANNQYKGEVMVMLHGIVPFTIYSYNEVTPTLGKFFLKQMEDIIIVSFVLIGIAVFFIFRSVVPSFAAIFGAANDIIIALGGMGLFGIPLGIASIGGLLMLIGYSIDTELLSSIRILKRGEDTPQERAFGAMKTGTTMTLAAIITFSILLIMSYETFIPTYFEISGVVLIGLVADLATTWLGNVPLILWYKLRKVHPIGQG
jgi:preprotein translocase subunit SecF